MSRPDYQSGFHLRRATMHSDPINWGQKESTGTMTKDEIEQFFEDNNDGEFLEFEKIQNPRSKRPDLHAFLLLDALFPGDRDMVESAEHDEIWLNVELEQLEGKVTEAQLLELIRCGVRIDDSGYLCMFV